MAVSHVSRTKGSVLWGLLLLYGLTFGALWPAGDGLRILFAGFLIPPLIWLTLVDLDRFEIPDLAVVWIVLVAIGQVFVVTPEELWLHIVTGVAVCALLWGIGEVYFRHNGAEGLGIGDAKLLGAGALLLGPYMVPELLLLPSLGGVVGYLMSRKHPQIETGIPFGPFIAYAIFVLNLLGPMFFRDLA